jgi:hypothetical protein
LGIATPPLSLAEVMFVERGQNLTVRAGVRQTVAHHPLHGKIDLTMW